MIRDPLTYLSAGMVFAMASLFAMLGDWIVVAAVLDAAAVLAVGVAICLAAAEYSRRPPPC